MEASAAGLAGAANGDGQAQQQGEAQQQGQEQQQQPDVAAQLQALQQQQQQQWEFLQNNPALQPPPEAEPEPAPAPDLSFVDNPALSQEQVTQQFQQFLDQAIEQRVQQALSPAEQRIADLQLAQQTQDLTAEFPELGQPAVAEKVMEHAKQFAEMASNGNQEMFQQLVMNPAVWRQSYQALRSTEMAAQQQSAGVGAQAATLEGAGGASPGGTGQGTQPTADSITEGWARSGRSVLPF